MQYDNITPATFLRRPNRFIAEVEAEEQADSIAQVRSQKIKN
jgi:DNA-binding sugar fermentation-stimulating protein